MYIKDLDSTNEKMPSQEQYTFALTKNTIVTTVRLPDKSTEHYAAALFVSAFINGQPATIVEGTSLAVENICSVTLTEKTLTYTLDLIDSQAMNDLKSRGAIDFETVCPVLVPHPEQSATSDGDSLERSASTISPSTDHITDACSGSEPRGIARVFRQPDFDNKTLHQMDAIFRAKSESSFRKICFSGNPWLDFNFRRTLEHILSVCCIPMPVQDDGNSPLEVNAFTITCGDTADHRIEPRASL